MQNLNTRDAMSIKSQGIKDTPPMKLRNIQSYPKYDSVVFNTQHNAIIGGAYLTNIKNSLLSMYLSRIFESSTASEFVFG